MMKISNKGIGNHGQCNSMMTSTNLYHKNSFKMSQIRMRIIGNRSMVVIFCLHALMVKIVLFKYRTRTKNSHDLDELWDKRPHWKVGRLPW